MTDSPINKQTFLYRFLVSSRYRIARHILLLLAVAAVSLNQNIYTYGAKAELLDHYVYLAGFYTLISYVIVGYLHLYLLVPRLLLKKKYLVYILYSTSSVLLLILIRYIQEYWIFTSSGIPPVRSSYFNIVSILDSLSDFMLNMICITGISMTVLLKHWMIENQRVNQLEKKQIQSEVDNLKEQVNPSLLFNTLNRTAVLSKSEPQKAADMVLQLSQLLRYQLYDGARDKVLLNSEITFVNNYLALEKFYSDSFDYQIVPDKELTGVLIPPLLLVPIIQYALKKAGKQECRPSILLQVNRKGQQIVIICRFNDTDTPVIKELDGFNARLALLYPDNYSLSVTQDKDQGISTILLKLNTHGK